jgi:hypothetical protein
LWGVTVMELSGGAVVPVPAAVLLGILGLGTAGLKLRCKGATSCLSDKHLQRRRYKPRAPKDIETTNGTNHTNE